MDTQTLILEQTDEANILYRQNKIHELEIETLHLVEIFKELDELVCIQGERLDIIEQTINDTKNKTEQANDELIVAEKHQKKYSKLKLFLAALAVGTVSGPIWIAFGAKAAIGASVSVGIGLLSL